VARQTATASAQRKDAADRALPLIRHGVDVKAVQRRLGHSSAAVTLGVYSHLWLDSDDRTREAVEQEGEGR